MHDPAEHALVIKALTCGLSNCVEWRNERTELRVRNDPDLEGLTPEGIKRLLREFVARQGPEAVVQVVEEREEYRNCYAHYYSAILPISGFPHGVFVEFVLSDDDPDVPCVTLVNAHRQRE